MSPSDSSRSSQSSASPVRSCRELFEQATALGAEDCVRFLDDLRIGEPALAAELQELLRHAQRMDTPLDTPLVGDIDIAALASAEGEAIPEHIGNYRVVRLLGRGSMGTVYEAVQESPRRTIALKLLRAGLSSEAAQQRFQLEADVLGRLDHPCIASIHEAGVADLGHGPRPFLAMEFVEGVRLNEWVAEQHLDTRARIQLLVRIGEALAHAHQRGVIHRDIKPGNIMVDREGRPRVLDFGVARNNETVDGGSDRDASGTQQHSGGSSRTLAGQLLGTLEFMSPEQAAGDPGAVDVRADVYSLGVVGYELLAGRLPYELSDVPLPEALRRIMETDGPSLAELDHSLRGDVSTIFSKALEKDPQRRYQSMPEFVGDLSRHLAHEPIVAQPTGAGERLLKFARRNRALVTGVTAGLLLLLLGLVAMSFGLIEAQDQAALAEQRLQSEREARTLATEALGEASAARELMRLALRDSEQSLEDARTVTTFVTEMLGSVDATVGGHDVKLSQVLGSAAGLIDTRFAERPHLSSRLHNTVAWAYRSLSMSDVANAHFERAALLSEEAYGSDDARTWKRQSDYGESLRLLGRFEEARATNRAAHDAFVGAGLGHEDDALNAALNLGRSLHDLQRTDEALALLGPVLELAQATRADSHPVVCAAKIALAAVHAQDGRPEQSEALLSSVLAALEADPNSAQATRQRVEFLLAECWVRMQRFEPAAAALDRLFEVELERYGEEHPDPWLILCLRADVHTRMGQPAQALELYERAIPELVPLLDDSHLQLAMYRRRQAGGLIDAGRVAEAEVILLELVELLDAEDPSQAPVLATALRELGAVHVRRLDTVAARQCFERGLKLLETSYGPNSLHLADTLMDLSALEANEQHWAASEEHGQHARVLYETAHGPNSIYALQLRANLARSILEQGRVAEAERELLSVLPLLREHLGSEHPSVLLTASWVARVFFVKGERERSLELYTAVLATLDRVLGADSPYTQSVRSEFLELQAQALD